MVNDVNWPANININDIKYKIIIIIIKEIEEEEEGEEETIHKQ